MQSLQPVASFPAGTGGLRSVSTLAWNLQNNCRSGVVLVDAGGLQIWKTSDVWHSEIVSFHEPATTHNKLTAIGMAYIGIHNWEEVFLQNVYPEVTFLQCSDGTSKVLCHPEYATAF